MFSTLARSAARSTLSASRQAGAALSLRSAAAGGASGRMAMYVGAGAALLGVGMMEGESWWRFVPFEAETKQRGRSTAGSNIDRGGARLMQTSGQAGAPNGGTEDDRG